MQTPSPVVIGAGLVALAVVAGVIASLQSFNAAEVACESIDSARAELQALYDTGVTASVQVFAEEKATIDERLSQCLSAKPTDPCADAQSARDAAVANFNGIQSPADDAPYAEFQTYFAKRDDAYANYKKAKETLDQCRAAQPPKVDVPYEQSNTKTCFDAYDASTEAARTTFTRDTQAMKAALTAALAALDAREKACHPPTGGDQFTSPPQAQIGTNGDTIDLASCRLINPTLDTELFTLQKRAAALPAEIQSVEQAIENVQKRMSPLRRDLAEVGTYIPPESTRTQFEGALNALRAERKAAIEAALEFYQGLLARRQAEKVALEQELSNINAQIAARQAEIDRENAARRQKFPTALHLAKPEAGGCEYYHCHGTLCGIPDPASNNCGHGSTSQGDVDCTLFIESYFKAAGI